MIVPQPTGRFAELPQRDGRSRAAGAVAITFVPVVPATAVAAFAPPQTIAAVVIRPLLYASVERFSLCNLRTMGRPVTILAFGLVQPRLP